ncbi:MULTISPECIES: ABC transporter ATP-binding protein [unclassified Rathayibacter]|uniref:ABC transporter ATP-binding protein n=1 Tax=unclassified Rathayibacter TaxID=2609250 RepID=UPI00188DB11B|nr:MULTISPECIES: ABC transporter ATP-binding protein [unclassified Rathayibacter]MBF4462793.1 ABC transporter ATP-binding protein [Rathayibacter sp. VKM Ac-2879]MBF4504207.1 ABC transporter ATP-binding protein [Rathayibacter sp. VKM Ac-2878]
MGIRPGEGIVAEGVSRAFGQVRAVRDASFEARPGEVTALIGPNGAGKTTLMLLLATLLRPDAGTLRVAGHDPVADPAAVRAELGWMPDVLGSWASLTARATLRTTGLLYGLRRDDAEARARQLLDEVDLVEFADRPTRVLSRGQKQRLSLARALVHDPSVLVLDEPASGLDPGARIALRDLVVRLAREGRTVLVSSHVLSELDEMATAAVYLAAGATASREAVARAARSLRAWRIEALAPRGAALADAVERLTGLSPQLDREAVLVPVVNDEAAAELLARLVASGVAVSRFAPAVGELEHTFSDLTRGSTPPAAEIGEDPR